MMVDVLPSPQTRVGAAIFYTFFFGGISSLFLTSFSFQAATVWPQPGKKKARLISLHEWLMSYDLHALRLDISLLLYFRQLVASGAQTYPVTSGDRTEGQGTLYCVVLVSLIAAAEADVDSLAVGCLREYVPIYLPRQKCDCN